MGQSGKVLKDEKLLISKTVGKAGAKAQWQERTCII